MERVVITGMGALTPVGSTVPAFWDGLLAGKSGIGRITQFDASGLAVQVAAEIRDFDPADYLPRSLVRDTDAFMQFAYLAAEEAIRQSGLCCDSPRVGVVMGTAMNGIATTAATQDALSRAVHKKVGPKFIPKILGNVAAAQIAITHRIRGPSYTLNTACSSGADAIALSALLLQTGKADAIVAVGADAILCPLVLYSLANAQALSRELDPARVCMPFDRRRSGFVIGEGGGALVLETERSALARGARIFGEVLGCGNTNDAYHVTAPDPSGEGAASAMRLALAEARLEPGQIGYINAHGTGTVQGDAAEADAIRQVFGSVSPPVSSTKAATGHMMGAGGITEVIACLKAIETGLLPPTLHCEEPDAELNLVTGAPVLKKIQYAMSNAFGFGGQNACVVVGAYQGKDE